MLVVLILLISVVLVSVFGFVCEYVWLLSWWLLCVIFVVMLSVFVRCLLSMKKVVVYDVLCSMLSSVGVEGLGLLLKLR